MASTKDGKYCQVASLDLPIVEVRAWSRSKEATKVQWMRPEIVSLVLTFRSHFGCGFAIGMLEMQLADGHSVGMYTSQIAAI